MIYIILGLPISILSVKVFSWGLLWTRLKFPFKSGVTEYQSIKNYLIVIFLGNMMFGVFALIPVFYFGYLLYSTINIITTFNFSVMFIVFFSIIQIITLTSRNYTFRSFYAFYKKEIKEFVELDENVLLTEDQMLKRMKMPYLVIFDILFFPMLAFIISDYLSSLL